MDVDDGSHVLAPQPVEQDDLVDAVQELRPKMPAHDLHDLGVDGGGVLAFLLHDEIFRAEIGGHDDQRVLEIDRAPLPVRQPSIVEHLQQHVEHVGMRLLDLVEQQHLIGPAPHGLGERAALLVADVARRRADQPRHRMFLHVFGHVEPHHGGLVVEQEARQRLGQLGLADASGAEKDEGANGPVGVLQPRPRAPHRRRHGRDRLALPDDAPRQRLLHVQQLLAFAL